MSRRTLFALALALAVPAAARADEWAGAQGETQPAGDYDVSVDLNPQPAVGPETFEQPLAAYGDWVESPTYGHVWRPRVAAGWRPYYYGRWEWTNEGWLWVSDEPFGWATYHYGRWAYDPGLGWIWVPGYQWAPAWVSWRSSGDVVGWAPLAPGYSVYVSTYPFVDFWWTFVPCTRFVAVPVYSVAYAPGYARYWYGATAAAPAYVPRGTTHTPVAPAWGGPAPGVIAQRVGHPIVPSRVVPAPAPAAGGGNRPGEIPVYRPDRPATPGRGPGNAPAPGWPGPRSGGTPPSGGNGRGPGTAPAPGWPGAGGSSTSPHAGNGRGRGNAPSPGWPGPRSGGTPPSGGSGRGPGTAPAPGWSGTHGGPTRSAYVPAPRPQGGGGRGGGGGGGHAGGGHSGGGRR